MFGKIKYLIACSVASVMMACGSGTASEGVADDLREAEAAVAMGDMEAARSVASRLMGNERLSHLSATDLARLSLVYMQIADSAERESNIAQATDLYRRAFDADADSAGSYYSGVSPEMYPYVTMLRTLVGHIDNPYDPEADSINEMELPLPELPDSLK